VAKKTIDLNSNPRDLMTEKVAVDGSIKAPPIAVNTQPTASTIVTPTTTQASTAITPFGLYNNTITSYPNDTVQLNITNAIDQYLETNFRINTYIKVSDLVTLDPEKD
jgi:hypothetical protein